MHTAPLNPLLSNDVNATLLAIKRGEHMQTKVDDIEMDHPGRAHGDVPKARSCLRCEASFWSEGFGQRICNHCKGSSVWRTEMPEGIGQGRRRSGGRSY